MAALRPLIEANDHLYHANKKLSAENATSEVNLQDAKRTINALVSKIAAQTGKTVGNNGQLPQRLYDVVRMLQAHSSIEDAEKSSDATDGSNNLELTMLTEQFKKINFSNERLNNEILDLKKQHAAMRNQKKRAAGKKNH